MTQIISFTGHCPHCGAAIYLKDVHPGEKINTWCPLCSEFIEITAPIPQSSTNTQSKSEPTSQYKTQYKTENYTAPVKKKPVMKWVLFLFASALIACAMMAAGIAISVAMPICCFAGGVCIIIAVINGITNISRKNDVRTAQTKPANQKATRAKTVPKRHGATKVTGYGKYSKAIASEEFRKLEGYLLDAHQILRHADDMEYENGPFITLRDIGNGGKNGYLCFETKIFHRPGEIEYNLPASDIEKVKACMKARSFTMEGGANSYNTLEKQFVEDVYGDGYVFKGGMPLCYDPDDGQWDANESCYVFRRTLTEFGTAYYENRSARQKLIKAAAYYWEKNNMDRGMMFSN